MAVIDATCRFARNDPNHMCRRRDGELLTGDNGDCHVEAVAQTAEQGSVLRSAEEIAGAIVDDHAGPLDWGTRLAAGACGLILFLSLTGGVR